MQGTEDKRKANKQSVNRLFDLRSKYRPVLEFLARTGCRPSEALKITQNYIDDRECTQWTVNGDGSYSVKLSGQFTKTGFSYRYELETEEGKRLGKDLHEIWK